MSCVFCDIVEKNDSNIILYNDGQFVAFKDISPAASVHFLLIPKTHLGNISELNNSHSDMLSRMKEIADRLLNDQNILKQDQVVGFHVPPFVFVPHLHLHLEKIYGGKPFGITCSTVSNGTISFESSFGYSKAPFLPFFTKTKLTRDTRFQVGEISQVLVSLAILRLVDQGLVDLDQDILQYIADLQFRNESQEKVTIRKLVNHLVDIEYQYFQGYSANQKLPSIQELLLGKSMKKDILIKSVGKYRYNEAGYVILQHIMETVAKKPFHQIMYEQILGPCGMDNSSFETTGNLSVGHIWYCNPIYFKKRVYPYASYPPAVKGLWTTSKDLALFLIQFCKCVNEEWDSLLSPLTSINLKSTKPEIFGWHHENDLYSVQGETIGFKSIIRNYENDYVHFHNILAKSTDIPIELKLEKQLSLKDFFFRWLNYMFGK
ncbi:hypothetical protein HK103_005642 [Boothiomyces macroporosus]|uniref:HIT domain-containing protein n=1 Tax=Boothiomyces macroporosus TaxID=261099 RepID=A0AAD5Y792_9FUNG|nr:hypothetical protein HK103_005642 [Boothiomyces macroporosus]